MVNGIKEWTRRGFLKGAGFAISAALGDRLVPKEAETGGRRDWIEVKSWSEPQTAVEKVKIGQEEVGISQPIETGKWENSRVFVYSNKVFSQAQDYGIKSLAEGAAGELILGWRNGIGIARLEKGFLVAYQPVIIPPEFGFSDIVSQIAPTKENSIYFGGENGFFWLKPAGHLSRLFDPTDLTGWLRRVDWFAPYGRGVVAGRETELYYFENDVEGWNGWNIGRKWLTPVRNDIGTSDQILGLATGVSEEGSVCYAIVSVNEDNDRTKWQRHLCQLSFSADPNVSLEVKDLGIVSSFAGEDFLRPAKLDLKMKVMYGRARLGGCCDQLGYVFLDTRESSRFKVAPADHYPDLNDVYLAPDGTLWTTMYVWGTTKIENSFSNQRKRKEAPADLIANPYGQSIMVGQVNVWNGHSFLGGDQFNNALLTQFRREHSVHLPLLEKGGK